ncbi:porin [Rhizorhabdus phycosphaerae]|uniref:porin n=1 Tax=Rhizorhabdus phycosphaerae TaxID=2711156 RepID=UPI001D0186EE|nr:porin [Rhizorhabdus phycosphaerae]
MMVKGVKTAMVGTALLASLALSVPVESAKPTATPKVKVDRKKARGIGFFTPAASDPRQAALIDRVGGNFAEPSFRFTPSGGNGKRAVTVAIRARSNRNSSSTSTSFAGSTITIPNTTALNMGLAPTAYSLGASVGWKHFTLSGDFARIDGGTIPDNRQLTDIGVSYSRSKWSTRLLFGTEKATGATNLGGPEEALSVDLGGSFSLTKNLELSGGVRYKSQRDHSDLTSDQRRDSQSVYVGTAFRF